MRIWLIAAAAIILAFAVYLASRSDPRMRVDPHAREVIERAKHRP